MSALHFFTVRTAVAVNYFHFEFSSSNLAVERMRVLLLLCLCHWLVDGWPIGTSRLAQKRLKRQDDGEQKPEVTHDEPLLDATKMPSTETVKTVTDGNKRLILAHMIWRHGDRSPVKICPKDPYQEDSWTFGGGGLGELSPKGMAQHIKLGKQIRELYVDSGFLSPYYDSREMYVHSTDVNRTILSAMANMFGMYGQTGYKNRAGTDFPSTEDWPPGVVPIPIHTFDKHTDYVANPFATCSRQQKLFQLLMNYHPEFVKFHQRPDVVDLLRDLTDKCGKNIPIDKLWTMHDTLLIEKIHKAATMRRDVPWYTSEFESHLSEVNGEMVKFLHGITEKPLVMQGIDVGLEIKRLRGGSMLDDVNTRMLQKLDCLGNSSRECAGINRLKYYAYSAHDHTIYSFLASFGIESEIVLPHGYPDYSSAVSIELWKDDQHDRDFFRLLYRANETSSFEPITDHVAGCGCQFCPLEVYQWFAKLLKPAADVKKFCETPPLDWKA